MPTGIGGIQDLPTCGSDGKWRDPNGKVIGESNAPTSIQMLNTIQTYDMSTKNTLTNEISGITKENTLICIEVLAHPNVPSAINTGYCNNKANFISFTGNAEWSYNNGKWIQNAPYNATTW